MNDDPADDPDDDAPSPSIPLDELGVLRADAMLTLRRAFLDFCSEHHVEIETLGDRDTLHFMSTWLRPRHRPIDVSTLDEPDHPTPDT